jgi:hypothetical protein
MWVVVRVENYGSHRLWSKVPKDLIDISFHQERPYDILAYAWKLSNVGGTKYIMKQLREGALRQSRRKQS